MLTQLVLQAALNTAVVTGLVPPKGIPHPFLCVGGSNLVMSLVSVGILVSLTRDADVRAVDDSGFVYDGIGSSRSSSSRG
ncbi:MAG: FtsW/RodA/SpoVE family cell cycle protein [Planctomycetaceae bacterium]